MIKRKMSSVRSGWNLRFHVDQDFTLYEQDTGRKIETKQQVLDHLFGNYNERPNTHLDLYLYTPQDKTWKHRVNMVWAFPVTLFCAPYRYIRYGQTGWTNKTWFGKFLLTSVGEDK